MRLDPGSPGPVLFRQAVQACGAWDVGVSDEGAGDLVRAGVGASVGAGVGAGVGDDAGCGGRRSRQILACSFVPSSIVLRWRHRPSSFDKSIDFRFHHELDRQSHRRSFAVRRLNTERFGASHEDKYHGNEISLFEIETAY